MKYFINKIFTLSKLKKSFLVGFFVMALLGQLLPNSALAQSPTRPPAFGDPGTTRGDETGYQVNYYIDPTNPNREVQFRIGPDSQAFEASHPGARATGSRWHYNNADEQMQHDLTEDPAITADYTVQMPDGSVKEFKDFHAIDDFLKKNPGAKVISRTNAFTKRLSDFQVTRDNPLPGVTGPVADFLGGRAVAIIGTILGIFLTIVSFFFLLFAKIVASFLIIVLQFNNFTSMDEIVAPWTTIRDLANMFFIVVLIIIAFATMLGKEEYNWKKLLPRLLVMAVLVNFSRTIAGIFIDVFQIVMLTFVKATVSNGLTAENFLASMGVSGKIGTLTAQALVSIVGLGKEGPILIVSAMLLEFMYLVIATSTLLTMLVILVSRIVVIWVLVILSPLAYVMSTFPQGSKYSSMWWEKFTSHIIVGPVLAFFIWLALKIGENASNTGSSYSGGAFSRNAFSEFGKINVNDVLHYDPNTFAGWNGNINDFIDPHRFVNLLISVTLFSAGMMIANSMSVVGGAMAKSWADKVTGAGTLLSLGAAARIGKAGLNAVDRGLARHPITFGKGDKEWGFSLSPTAMKAGWDAYWHQTQEEAMTKSTGMNQDFLNSRGNVTLGMGEKIAESRVGQSRLGKLFGLSDLNKETYSGRRTVFGRRAEKAHITKMMNEYSGADLSEETLTGLFIDAHGKGNVEEQEALWKLVTRNNMQDGFASQLYQKTGKSVVDLSLMEQVDVNSKIAMARSSARARIEHMKTHGSYHEKDDLMKQTAESAGLNFDRSIFDNPPDNTPPDTGTGGIITPGGGAPAGGGTSTTTSVSNQGSNPPKATLLGPDGKPASTSVVNNNNISVNVSRKGKSEAEKAAEEKMFRNELKHAGVSDEDVTNFHEAEGRNSLELHLENDAELFNDSEYTAMNDVAKKDMVKDLERITTKRGGTSSNMTPEEYKTALAEWMEKKWNRRRK